MQLKAVDDMHLSFASSRRVAHLHRSPHGFTLIELMIVVAIVAILTAIAVSPYSDYVLRAKLIDASYLLLAGRANMERYFQDNLTYVGGPCSGTLNTFTMSCSVGPTASPAAYTLQAVGSGATLGFTYTVDQSNTMKSTVSPAWGGAVTTGCWIMKKGQTC